MIAPKPPTGSNAKSAWMRWAHGKLLSLRQKPVAGQKSGVTTRGSYTIGK